MNGKMRNGLRLGQNALIKSALHDKRKTYQQPLPIAFNGLRVTLKSNHESETNRTN